jgi:isoquinoline 1-oxidoreductase beta subunit
MSSLLEISAPAEFTRRSFLKVSALAGGGLLFGFRLGAADALAQSAPTAAVADFTPNAFIRLMPNGAVSLIAPNSEMGQGAKTALPMIIAEEMDLDWRNVTVYQGDLNPAYGGQRAVGSSSTQSTFMPLRQAGANARALLVQAAAQTWGVPESECTADKGFVLHAASQRRVAYGDLTAKAAALTPAGNAPLKDPKDYKLVGTRVPGVDNARIVTGQPLFGIDVKLPGLLYASYVRCPVLGGKPVGANLAEVKQLPGVKDAFLLGGITGLAPGVAIVADSTWNAFSAAEKLKVEWDNGAGISLSSKAFAEQAATFAQSAPVEIPAGAKTVEAAYHYPFLAHSTLEPQNCTALFKNGVMEMWCPTQVPASGQGLVVRGLGLPAGNVIVHVTRIGGGFGRRGSNEFSLEVAAIAQKMEGVPVKLTWTREQDMQQDNYRSAGWHFFKAGVDGGKVVALTDSFVKKGDPNNNPQFPFNAIPGARVVTNTVPGAVPTGYWRAPGDNGNCWAVQSFVDELAHAAGRDPVDFQLELLSAMPAAPAAGGRGGRGGMSAPRMNAVVKLAMAKAGWGKKLPRGQGQGFAISATNGACVAVIAQVTVSPAGELKIDRLVAAVDAGLIVNLSSAESQVQGSLLDGIGAAWFLKVTVEKGLVQQTNLDEYPLIRMADAPPAVEVHFIVNATAPTGLGEPALPPAAPAVCNAIFAATGKRIRTLPFSGEDLKWS